MEPVYEVLKLGAEKEVFERNVLVEKRTDKSSESIGKILSISSVVLSEPAKIDDDKVFYGGRVVFYVCYLDENGALKKIESSGEFALTESISLPETVCGATATATVNKTEYSLESGSLTLSAVVGVTITLSKCIEQSVFAGGENVVADKKEMEIIKSYGVKSGVYPLEQEFELGFPVQEVVSQNLSTVITSVQSGVGCIIVDGETYLKVLLLQNIENGDIIREEKVIPFRMEIEHADAMPQMFATASVKEKAIKTDVSVDETTGKSSVLSTVTLAFEGEVFAEENTVLATDVFSVSEELDVTCGEIAAAIPEKICVCDAKVSGRVQTEELPAGIRITAVSDDGIELTGFEYTEGKILLEGVFSLRAFVKDSEGKVRSIKAEVPFSKTVDCPIADYQNKRITATTKCAYARLISLSEMEIGADVMFSVFGASTQKIKYVKQVTVLGEKKTEDCALSVYIGAKGEELWSLAKRLNVCPESLLATNKELQFPLTGKERIVVYRQK